MLKHTPLYEAHVSIGARMVEFAGWEMPVQYAGHVQEHMAVREAAGLFDVSHMGEVEIRGADALALVQRIISFWWSMQGPPMRTSSGSRATPPA